MNILVTLTKYFSARDILRHKVEHALGLHHLVELDNVGMVDQLHHLHLTVDLGEVDSIQLGLVNDLDCDLGKQMYKRGSTPTYIRHIFVYS